eukprot:TRINITY_DN4616_c0_g1_i6.p1 TRINITY_DN4616_c0_g1~~TRINITY_DN4616_c0_g1_i6.p1  ORF type:complete len:2171 (-),score=323.68 TRINITY_DN4616_c0_g1_i6:5955-12314(-)
MKIREGENKLMFGWTPLLMRWAGVKTYFTVSESLPIYSFMRDMLDHLGFSKSFPFEEMDDWSERTDLGIVEEWAKKTEMERVSLWFGAFTPSSSKTQFVPEFAQFRDLIFQTKMIMDEQIRSSNPELFVSNKLWYTRQLLPSWEPCKGRQDTEAWIAVKVNNGTVILGTRPENYSPTIPSSITRTIKEETETSILFCENLNTFDDALSTEDSEKLATYLTAPYLKIPLVLSFFSDNRVGTLLNPDLQCLLERVLFEPGKFDSDIMPISEVPLPPKKNLGTKFGLLYEEMKYSPDAVIKPLLKMMDDTISLCVGSYSSVFVCLALFFTRAIIRALNIRGRSEPECPVVTEAKNYLQETVFGLITGWLTEAKAENDLDSSVNFYSHLALLHDITENLPEFIFCSAAVTAWHGKVSIDTVKGTYSRYYLMNNPIYDVFLSFQRKRNTIINWIASQPPEKAQEIIQKTAEASIGYRFGQQDETKWEEIRSKPPMCQYVVESEHLYRGPIQMYQSVRFPGAEYISIRFDGLCSIAATDYVTIYKDESLTSTWGPPKIQAVWPGASGRPPLVIPTDHFIVFFYGDATSKPDWGFKLIATAPVSMKSIDVLYGKFSSEGGISQIDCQEALALFNNDVERAEEYLSKGLKKEVRVDTDIIRGLYVKTTERGTTHVNMQTGEVYVGNRLGMPVPQEIVGNPDFRHIFKSDIPYCTVVQNREHLTSIHIQHDNYNYYVEAWAPIKNLGHELEIASKVGNKKEVSNRKPSFVNAPVMEKVEGGGEESFLTYLGHSWETYHPGQCGWLSSLFDPVLAEASTFGNSRSKSLSGAVRIWMRTGSSPEGDDAPTLVMFVSPSGSIEECDGNPGRFYEVYANQKHKSFEVYALLEIGRKTQRSLCFSSNSETSLAYLAGDIRKRKKPFVLGCERQGGNFFGFMFELGGDLTACPGSGSLHDVSVASVIIRRKSSDTDLIHTDPDRGWEEFVTSDALRGLIPEVLLEQYDFWKVADNSVIKGYPKEPKDDWSDYAITLFLQENEGRSECVIKRQNQRESMILLNLTVSEVDSALGNLSTALSSLDSLSHVLVWSRSEPKISREEVEISVIELPRLRIRFVMKKDEEGVRFESLDHTGLYLSNEQQHQWQRILPHSLVLENQLKERFLLVPNYPLHPISITSCPLSSQITSLRTSDWFENVKTRFYLYPIHLSEVFLKTETLSSSLYLVLVSLMRRDYEGVAKMLGSCSTDTPLSKEELWILGMVRHTIIPGPGVVIDTHPNAVAIRLKLALLVIESGAKTIPWQYDGTVLEGPNYVVEDMTNYLAKFAHVSALCRLGSDEEYQLLVFLKQFPTRLRYIETLKLANEESPGSARHMIIPPVAYDIGGLEILQEYKNASTMPKQSHYTLMSCTYARPKPIKSCEKSVELIMRWFDDELNGKTWSLGWALIYDILLGRVYLPLTASQLDVPTEPANQNALSKASGTLVALESQQGLRSKCSYGSFSLAKLMLDSMLLKVLQAPPQRRRQYITWIHLLSSVVVAVSVDIKNFYQTAYSFEFPSFPANFGTHDRKSPADQKRLEELSNLVEEGARKIMHSSIWTNHEFTNFKKQESFERPTTLIVKQSTSLSRVPVIANTARTSLSIQATPKSGEQEKGDAKFKCLEMGEEDLKLFGSKPLGKISDEFVELLPQQQAADDMHSSLPWEEDLKKHAVARTTVANEALNDLNNQIKEAYDQASSGLVPELKFLGPSHFNSLQKEARNLKLKQEQKGSSLSQSRDLLTSSSSSSTVPSALSSLKQVKERLLQQQKDDREILAQAFPLLERLANSIEKGYDDRDQASRDKLTISQVLYYMKHDTGKKAGFWVEMLCGLLLSTSPFQDLTKINEFITQERCEDLLQAISQVLLRSARLVQVNRALSLVSQLTSRMRQFVIGEVELLIEEDYDSEYLPSSRMIEEALNQKNDNASRAFKYLQEMAKQIENIVESKKDLLQGLSPSDSYGVVFAAYHASAFVPEATSQILSSVDPQTFLSLARRGCYWKGKALVLPKKRDTSQSSVDGQAHLDRLQAMIHALRFTASNLAHELSAQRHYATINDYSIQIDPRFLVFEFVANIVLRERQIQLVKDFVTSAQSGQSSCAK